ncbi:RagB/SusD family nutrient uptake outer membrane protein [Olivibacter sp. SDN3]|uniref:RagB/SusD family nutrient uptake outer membrane protein n=1 Tax=Olivibacter sp. SDN3 TaxID=2764720 RepID=UPI0016518778|nr:RagB/SusD family nutrient uptake outer membrane protein [Olivibacter sp. SDN3]QNL51741.1 RagB/SusD family nutrient uptake outer membrane protein [Olivibacter sp. SDN3]
MNTLKNLYKTGLILAFGLLYSGCKKFLEEDPKNFVSTANFYTTADDAISAVNSIYAYLNAINEGSFAGVYHSSFWVAAGLASDELHNQQPGAPALDQLANFTYASQNSALLEIWRIHYKAITVANIAIERIPAIDMDGTLRTRLIGEARFLRALLYFNMVRMFGSIPLVLQEEEPLVPEVAAVEIIYQQIIADLEEAEALPFSYPAGNGRGRATTGAAKALLAKVYLTLANWEQAAAKALEIINEPRHEYGLWDDYAQAFSIGNRGGKEAVFSVGFGFAGGAIIFWEDGQQNIRLLPRELTGMIPGVNAQGWQYPTQQLYDVFEPNDRRRAVTFITEINNQDGSTTSIMPYIRKYWDSLAEPNAGGTEADFPVIRYADVLLTYAEAANELNQTEAALTYLNIIRRRARFDGSTYQNTLPDYTNLGRDAIRQAILQERRMEFVAEGHRWFDLVRTGTLETAVPIAKPGVTPAARNYLFPIPLEERDLNEHLPANGY